MVQKCAEDVVILAGALEIFSRQKYDPPNRSSRRPRHLFLLVFCVAASPWQRSTAAADLDVRTTEAYERHMAAVAKVFAQRSLR